MAWKTKLKNLAVTKTVPHSNSDPSVIGRAPGILSINFSPLELFGAAARCSHLHTINPAIVTPESLMIAALLEQHVDDVKNDFAIEQSADTFKDFVKSYFAGTVASGLSYLAMINDGYVWADHFENLGGGAIGVSKSPDFVFTGYGTGVALMESKGSRSASSSTFDTTVGDGYTDQVEPHLGHVVGGVIATHGYCIGAYLKSTTSAELRIHHTAVPVGGTSGGSADPQSISVIQQGNYATAFTLAHSETLGRAIRNGEGPDRLPFVRFGWRGRSWLTSYVVDSFFFGPGFKEAFGHFRQLMRPKWLGETPGPSIGFAIEEKIALTALAHYIGDRTKDAAFPLDFPTLPLDQEEGDRERRDGVFFPDGLAIVSHNILPMNVEAVVWSAESGQLGKA